ncbi:MAG: shikimate kinase [Nocardioidaceae bacterium]|nr:shikimate kinase [Nocardioidaceae bacterium]
MRPKVVLVGAPGAGKSTVGEHLAQRWSTQFHDTDTIIEKRAGQPISEIFIDAGEPAFRALEAVVVAEALASCDGVLALGGGAVMSESTRALLVAHRVVFLDVGLAEAASRVGLGATRPLLLGNVRRQLKALLDARRPLYREVATVTVDTDGLSAQAVADEVERSLHG